MKQCKPNDWQKWANGTCTFDKSGFKISKKSKKSMKFVDWKLMKDWSWTQISGFTGTDRVISQTPIVFMCQTRSGKIETKTIQTNKKNVVLLTHFIKKLESLFINQNGDQSIQEIIKIHKRNEVSIFWLYFDS